LVPDPEEKKLLSLSDSELMALVRKGSRSAFARILKRYERRILNFFRHLGVVNDVEDLAQETFLRLYKYRKRYREKAPFGTFLFRLASQVHLDYLRKKKRSVAAVQLSEDSGFNSSVELEAEEEVEKALRRLSEPLRSVVVLRVFQNFSYEEVAEILSIPVGTAKSRMFHALRVLREYFESRELKDSKPR